MQIVRTFRFLAALAVVGLGCLSSSAWAQSPYRNPGYVESELPPGTRPAQLVGVGIDEKLGSIVDLDLEFVAEDGYPHKLREYFFKDRPVILDLVYYGCPQLCTLILNAQAEVMKQLASDQSWTPGNEYEVVTISIDPREAFDVARVKKEMYLREYGKPAPGWHFLTDHKGNAARLAKQVGFNYRYDARSEQYAHPAAIMVLTPVGKVARYLYGIQYKAFDLRLGLAEASENRTSMTIEKVLLLCFHYDASAGKYVKFAQGFMMVGGVAVMALLGLFLFYMVRADRARQRAPRERMA